MNKGIITWQDFVVSWDGIFRTSSASTNSHTKLHSTKWQPFHSNFHLHTSHFYSFLSFTFFYYYVNPLSSLTSLNYYSVTHSWSVVYSTDLTPQEIKLNHEVIVMISCAHLNLVEFFCIYTNKNYVAPK